MKSRFSAKMAANAAHFRLFAGFAAIYCKMFPRYQTENRSGSLRARANPQVRFDGFQYVAAR
jgi:hypothetical protein